VSCTSEFAVHTLTKLWLRKIQEALALCKLIMVPLGSRTDKRANRGWALMSINIKNCKALLKKVVIGRAVTALKQQKSKGKGEETGIAEIVHLMKPITRSPDTSSSSSSSSSNSNK
jgi:hypothetical protein